MNAVADAIDPQAFARSPIDGAVHVPINLLQPSTTNPRKHFDEAKLQELAASIGKLGLIQPILVRPRTAPRRGEPLYEIVAGERRFRASKLARQEYMPAIVRDMADHEVIELQLIENLQREDLTALEEADGYHTLLQKTGQLMGLKVDDLAARIGKSRSHIFQRLKLRELGKAGRKALEAGEISASVALLIARLRTEADQAEATLHIVQGWGGEPMSYRNAQAYVQQQFMLKLGHAPFKIDDATLVPEAGSCRECPKRAGANPDLFNDVDHADTCTDAACFRSKEEAHRAQVRAKAEAEGVKVISGAEAKKLTPHGYGDPKGYLRLDETHYELGDKPLAKLLGKDAPEVVLIENPITKDLVRTVRQNEAVAVLKDKGVLKTSRMPTTSNAEREAEARRKDENEFRARVCEQLLARLPQAMADGEFCDQVIRTAAHRLYHRQESVHQEQIDRLMGWGRIGSPWQDQANRDKLRARFAELTNTELVTFFAVAACAPELKVGTYEIGAKKAAPESHALLPLATAAGVDPAAIRAELKAEATAKAKAKALTPEKALAKAVKAPAKKAASSAPTPASTLSAAAIDPFRT